jgi:Peptidase S46
MKLLAAAALLLAPLASRSDEGMWTFDAFPKDRVARAYGFAPSDAWLDHLRLSSARLARGCSASFVSDRGLVMTNHHCAHACIEQVSTAERDHVKTGFYAPAAGDEVRCPNVEVNQLLSIGDVTARMTRATAGLEGARFFGAQKAETARIEKECQTSDRLRCDVVSLYHGGVYALYRYKRYQDVRLVFAPEFSIAFFGGDPDNFEFPRWDLDVAFLRVWEDGEPARTDHFLRLGAETPREGELTFVSGHPGGTARHLTVAELDYLRDIALPERMLDLAEYRGVLTEYARRGPEARRTSQAVLFGVENALKASRGRFAALVDRDLVASKAAAEKAFRDRLAKYPEKARRVLPAFDAIARAEADLARIRAPLRLIEHEGGFRGDLFHHARTLVRAAEERPKPSETRLREFRDSALPVLTQALFSTAPIHDDLEILKLAYSLGKLREELGPDDPVVRKVLGRESPEELATRLVRGTGLRDVGLRRRLWEGGKAAIDASADPMILLARLVDGDARAVRKKYEDEIESVVQKSSEIIARARFELDGTASYPDATFTLRLSYGAVKGYEERGRAVGPATALGGAFDRATGQDPFALPPSWLAAKGSLDLATPFDFVTTNDIIGGNSGSPVVNARGEVVGVVFDGNIESLAGDVVYDGRVNRTVAVTTGAILEALEKIYGAGRLLEELRPQRQGAPGGGRARASPGPP